MSSPNSTSTDISDFRFPGGLPGSQDLAPSVIFLVIYGLSIPVFIWRLVRRESRSKILIRPGIFLVDQIGVLALRAAMSKSSYGANELIAELVMASVGLLFLIGPILSLWERLVDAALSREGRPCWITTLTRLLRILLMVAILITIVGSSLISSAINDSSKISTVMQLRKVAAVLTLIIILVAPIAVVLTTRSIGLNPRRSALLIGYSAPLIVVAAYRMALIIDTNPSSPVQEPWAFWVLQMLFELIAYLIVISFPINTYFPGSSSEANSKTETVGV